MSFLTTPDGVRLRLTDRGAGHDRTIVLVHGWKLSHRVFEHAILRLSRSFRVVAYDLRGMGESDKPDCRYDFDEHADDLAFVLEHLGLDDVTLVGWSMGCSVSLRHMERGGARVGRLGLINGPIRLARTDDDAFPWSMTEDVLEEYFRAIEDEWPLHERRFTEESLHVPHSDLVDVIFHITQQTPLDVVVLHHVTHRARDKRLADTGFGAAIDRGLRGFLRDDNRNRLHGDHFANGLYFRRRPSNLNLRHFSAREAVFPQHDAAELQELLAALPNIPAPDVPQGADEHGNVEVRRWGEPNHVASPKDHVELGEGLGMLDFEAAARMSGARFTVAALR